MLAHLREGWTVAELVGRTGLPVGGTRSPGTGRVRQSKPPPPASAKP